MLETVASVLEQTAFMFPEPADMADGINFEDFDFILVSLDFFGDQCGHIRMIVPVDFCAELSANLLGEDIGDTDPEENNYDSAREMLNIVSGQLLVNLFGDKALFSLANLTVNKLEKDELFSFIEKSDYVCSMVEDYPVIIIFEQKEAVHDN
jgi:hypothetical protein